jgi:putative restriction endonuclease
MVFLSIINKFEHLKVDRSKGAPAPHKAILLLSIFESIEHEEIRENRIYITPELVARFKNNWSTFVVNNKFSPNFSLPFYHLKSEGFWHLVTEPGKELLLTASNSIKSFSALKNAVAYAFFDDTVFETFMDDSKRQVLKQLLLATYLNEGQVKAKKYDLFYEIENQILHESTHAYQAEIARSDEEEIFVRGGLFKRIVPKIYNYTCCISGMRITTTRDVQMVDACHIVPFAESHDDTIKNGLSLSPNFHRAFDRLLITINEHFEVIVSNNFIESGLNSIKAFHGSKIHLPTEQRYHPSKENLNWHHERFVRLNG